VAFRELARLIDEQHRFGVLQRAIPYKGTNPDALAAMATPIPRTLALGVRRPRRQHS
jgi:RecG-like helicase